MVDVWPQRWTTSHRDRGMPKALVEKHCRTKPTKSGTRVVIPKQRLRARLLRGTTDAVAGSQAPQEHIWTEYQKSWKRPGKEKNPEAKWNLGKTSLQILNTLL